MEPRAAKVRAGQSCAGRDARAPMFGSASWPSHHAEATHDMSWSGGHDKHKWPLCFFGLDMPRRLTQVSALWCAATLALGVAEQQDCSGQGSMRRRGTPDLPEAVKSSVGMDLVLVRPGEFMMGAGRGEVARLLERHKTDDSDWFNDERPVHRVRITKPFYVAKHETTNAQFRQFAPGHRSRRFMGHDLDQGDQPAVWVSWQQAVAFCSWLSKREGRSYRLPTEAEWEYACRAGTQTPFHWGSTVGVRRLNYADRSTSFSGRDEGADDGFAAAARVGSYPPNPFGLHDMLGNVWEWCADRYGKGYYASSPQADPPGPSAGVMRVCRGGAWNVFAPDARCAKRGAYLPSDGDPWIGFRVVMAAEPAE